MSPIASIFFRSAAAFTRHEQVVEFRITAHGHRVGRSQDSRMVVFQVGFVFPGRAGQGYP